MIATAQKQAQYYASLGRPNEAFYYRLEANKLQARAKQLQDDAAETIFAERCVILCTDYCKNELERAVCQYSSVEGVNDV